MKTWKLQPPLFVPCPSQGESLAENVRELMGEALPHKLYSVWLLKGVSIAETELEKVRHVVRPNDLHEIVDL
jgi:hypothetical protein